MALASLCVSSATLFSPGRYIVEVSSDHGSDAFLLAPMFRRTVAYICRSSGSTYRWLSSKTTKVSFPPSFAALDAVEGTISPPPGRSVRVRPAALDGSPSESGPSVRLK